MKNILEDLIGKTIRIYVNNYKYQGVLLDADHTHIKINDRIIGIKYFLRSDIETLNEVCEK